MTKCPLHKMIQVVELAILIFLLSTLPGCKLAKIIMPQPDKLNLLIISIDTLRADHVSCYGYDEETTPHIDQLAYQGHLFTNAYTTMPTTLPAHASLFTSLYPTQLSTRRNGAKVPAEATTLAEILESSGYATAAFVSATIMDARYGLNQGFHTYDEAMGPGMQIAAKTLAKATAWLMNHRDGPFFLFTHFFDPHTPYYAPEDFRNKFDAPNRETPPEFVFLSNPSQFTPHLVRKVIAAYDAEIAYADWAVGKLISELDRLDLGKHTLVVLVSDHGESLDELITRYGYAFDHGEFLYEHQLRIPLIIRMPERVIKERNIVHTSPVSIVDVMPTILDMLQIDPPGLMAGQSLIPMLHKEKVAHDPIFSEMREFKTPPKPYLAGSDYSIIDDKWHLIFSTIRGTELYNLLDDLSEISNLRRERKETEALIKKLKSRLEHLNPLFGPSIFETDREAIEQLRSLGYVE